MRRPLLPMISMTLLAAIAIGCASYHDRYRAEHPGWVAVGPSYGLGVDELVASLHAPPLDQVQSLMLKLVILRTDMDPWQEYDLAALDSGELRPGPDHDYAVIATKSCQSTEQLESHREVQTSWYLLPGNRLGAWDHYDFAARCVFVNEFSPAAPPYDEPERLLVERTKSAPRSTLQWANQTYRKGILLASVGRVADAETMLAAGDAQPDSGGERGGQMRFERGVGVSMDQPTYRTGLRAQLVEAIAAAKQRAAH